MTIKYPYRSTKRRWLAWSVAVLIIAGAISMVQMLNRWSEASLRVVDRLNQIETQSAHLSALEWQAMARRAVDAQLAERNRRLRTELDGLFDRLDSNAADSEFLDLRLSYIRFVRAIDEQLRWLSQGQLAKAMEIDAAQVDPAYDALSRQIQTLHSRYSNSSRSILLAVNTATSALLVLAAGAVGLLLSRFESAERSRELLQSEQILLRRSEQRLRSLVHNSSDILAILNPLPPTVKFISESSNRILGRRAEALTGTDICRFIHPDDVTKMQQFLGECAFRATITHMVEVRFRHGSGHWVPLEILGDNRMEDEAIQGIVIVLREKLDPAHAGRVPSATADFEVPSKVIH